MARKLVWTFVLLSISQVSVANNLPSFRQWTDLDGRVAIASWDGGLRHDGTITLRDREGAEFQFPISRLSDSDRQFVLTSLSAAPGVDSFKITVTDLDGKTIVGERIDVQILKLDGEGVPATISPNTSFSTLLTLADQIDSATTQNGVLTFDIRVQDLKETGDPDRQTVLLAFARGPNRTVTAVVPFVSVQGNKTHTFSVAVPEPKSPTVSRRMRTKHRCRLHWGRK